MFLADVYDGDIEEGNGLGVLTDGQLGQPIQFSEHGISRGTCMCTKQHDKWTFYASNNTSVAQ